METGIYKDSDVCILQLNGDFKLIFKDNIITLKPNWELQWKSPKEDPPYLADRLSEKTLNKIFRTSLDFFDTVMNTDNFAEHFCEETFLKDWELVKRCLENHPHYISHIPNKSVEMFEIVLPQNPFLIVHAQTITPYLMNIGVKALLNKGLEDMVSEYKEMCENHWSKQKLIKYHGTEDILENEQYFRNGSVFLEWNFKVCQK